MTLDTKYSQQLHIAQELLHINQLKTMIECAIISPFVKNEKPISLMIIAKAESGKTSTIKMYATKNKSVEYMTDCTAYGIQSKILPRIEQGEIRTLMIADFLTPICKAHKTKMAFIGFLNNLIEEGIARIETYNFQWDRPAKANVITAVTDEAIKDGRHEWAKLGFLSRFIIFSYSYSLSAVIEILNAYSRHGLTINHIKIHTPRKEVDIQLNPLIADKLNPIAVKIGEQFNLYGLRAKINLRSLLKAIAYRNGRTFVTEQDFQELLELTDYMNLDYNPLR